MTIKIITPSKLLIQLPVLSAQRKDENNSCKIKSEVRQIL